MLQVRVYDNVYSNFRFIRSLNEEYLKLDIGKGKVKYTEREKVSLEQAYITFAKREQDKVD